MLASVACFVWFRTMPDQAQVARADVMIENYAPGVLDRLGIGPKAMTSAVPGLIGISILVNAWGVVWGTLLGW